VKKNVPATKPANDRLPIKPVIKEITALKHTFREILRRYGVAIEVRIASLSKATKAAAEVKTPALERVHDLRDMLILLRGVKVKPDKGKRRDLKRVESLLDELETITRRW
jgi:hypothetical protein